MHHNSHSVRAKMNKERRKQLIVGLAISRGLNEYVHFRVIVHGRTKFNNKLGKVGITCRIFLSSPQFGPTDSIKPTEQFLIPVASYIMSDNDIT